jgi:hypothetical protein
MGNIQVMNKCKSLYNLTLRERQDFKSKTYLQHLHEHFNDVSDGIIRPVAISNYYLPTDFVENAQK